MGPGGAIAARPHLFGNSSLLYTGWNCLRKTFWLDAYSEPFAFMPALQTRRYALSPKQAKW
jgi:hypothetical protein